ncbi:MAG: hydantoinase/oxoprolinase family protein [Candidatus Hodarchaeales archaeon]|jgi:probable H4MPT-linked C1 transfer pathway protein
MQKTFLGLDIGGANTKITVVNQKDDHFNLVLDDSFYFPFWEKKDCFKEFLIGKKTILPNKPAGVGVTMTAELSDCYETKAEGVEHITRSVMEVFPVAKFYSTTGQFLEEQKAVINWREISAANWHASASLIGEKFPNCIFIDTGSTTTDIIPVKNGYPGVKGKDDVNRLINGELIYTGVLRTNLIALTGMKRFPFDGSTIRGSPEYFACTADVYRVLGFINDQEYAMTTPDGRGTSVDECLGRIAKFVCGDLQLLNKSKLVKLCQYLMSRQVEVIAEGVKEVMKDLGLNKESPAAITGSGGFLAEQAAKQAGIDECIHLTARHATVKADVEFSPALAMAVLVSRIDNDDSR